MKLFTNYVIAFAIFSVSMSFAPALSAAAIDTTNIGDDEFNYNFDYNEFIKGDFQDFNLIRYLYAGKLPIIEVNYSLNAPAIHSDYFDDKFAQTAGLEFAAGYTKNKLFRNNELIRSTYDYLSFTYYSQDLGKKEPAASKLQMEGWKITWGDNTGYGWVLSESADLT